MDKPVLWYVHDPMCSWCWGFRPAHTALIDGLNGEIPVRRLLGGLAPDSDHPMPEEMRNYLKSTWHRIEQRVPGTRFNFDFWTSTTPKRSTWPACRAVIAARAQNPDMDEAMTHAIQRAYYLDARNPSEIDTLRDLAADLGLDTEKFSANMASTTVRQSFAEERESARIMGAHSFPSLILERGGQHHPITIDYTRPELMLKQVDGVLTN
ncbi:MAG: DsbA family protein [Gammaproteobacteria bacterium]